MSNSSFQLKKKANFIQANLSKKSQVTQSLISATRPLLKKDVLPAVPGIGKYKDFDQWISAFALYLKINVSNDIGSSVEMGSYVSIPLSELSSSDVITDTAMRDAVKAELGKAYAQRKTKLEIDKTKAYNIMVGQLSIASEELIKRECPNWDRDVISSGGTPVTSVSSLPFSPPLTTNVTTSKKIKDDVLELIKAYRATHRTNSIGLTLQDRIFAENYFANLRMFPDTTLEDFILIFDSAIETMVALGATRPSDDVLSIQFINKLDNGRYNNLKTQLSNAVIMKTGNYPATYSEAQRIASKFLVPNSKGGSSAASTFMMRSQPKKTSRGVKVSDKKFDKVCKYFAAGTCNRGDQCRFKHVLNDSKDPGKILISTEVEEEFHPDDAIFLNLAEFEESEILLARISPEDIILDTGGERHLFCNENLCQEVKAAEFPFKFKGISGNTVESNKIGMFVNQEVPISPEVRVNLLSFSQVKDSGAKVEYSSEYDMFIVQLGTKVLRFYRTGKLYVCRVWKPGAQSVMMHQTVELNRKEIEAMRRVEDFHRKLGYPSEHGMGMLIKAGANLPFTLKDVRNHLQAFGPSAAYLKGRSTKETVKINSDNVLEKELSNKVNLTSDIMHVYREPFLISIINELDLVLITHMTSKFQLKNALLTQLQIINKHGFVLESIVCDNELITRETEEATGNIKMLPRSPGQHAGKIERKIRFLKEIIRSVLSCLPFQLNHRFVQYLVLYCVNIINLFPTSNMNLIPREQFAGVKIDFPRHIRLQFGDYCQVSTRDTNNSMKERTF